MGKITQVKGEAIVKTPGTLKQSDFQLHSTTVGGLGVWDYIFKKEVEKNSVYEFSPQDIFGAYLKRDSVRIDGAIAFENTGGTYTDEAVPANDAVVNDMNLMPAVHLAGDYYAFGSHFSFSAFKLVLGTSGTSVAKDGVWQYFSANTGWTALPGVVDASVAFTAAPATYLIKWILPRDWVKTTIAGLSMFWVRFKPVTADYVIKPLGTSATIGGAIECEDREPVKIEIRDNEENLCTTIFKGTYQQVKGYPDANLESWLNCLSDPIQVRGGWKIYVMSQSLGGLIDASACMLNLTCKRFASSQLSPV